MREKSITINNGFDYAFLASEVTCMNITETESICAQIVKERRRIGLQLKDVQRVDSYLANEWGIVIPEPPDEWTEQFDLLAGELLAQQYWEVHDELAEYHEDEKEPPVELETLLYDLIADQRISGHVHSQKRTEILDAGCLLIYLMKTFGISGPILDLGCHIGYHAHLLANETMATVHGVDLSSKAIDVASSRNTTASKLSFSADSLSTLAQNNSFRMIYAVRSVTLSGKNLNQISELLEPGGIAVIFPHDAVIDEPTQQAINDADFGWGFSDVAGGYVGSERGLDEGGFEIGIVLVLIKGGSLPVPFDYAEEATSVWDNYFKVYANDPSTNKSEKTQSYSRAYWMLKNG